MDTVLINFYTFILLMKVTKNIKKIVSKFPKLSNAGYQVLKRYWNIKANYINYNYPKQENIASITKTDLINYNKARPYGPMKKICYAPSTNLHFQMNGDVSSCSFNYDVIIGNVHQESVKAIWFGKKADVFRSTLANFNLDKCLSCSKVIAAKNYNSFPPLKYDMFGDDNTEYPTQMSFEMSNLCNYECIMCNEDFSSLIRKNRAKLPPVKYVYPTNFVEQLKEFIPHLKMTTFIGGEPLLIKPYIDIWEAILQQNKDCIIHIQTNGSILTDKFLKMIESRQFEIGISLDALNKKLFEAIRINANYDEVMENVSRLISLKNEGKVFLNINFCPLTVNWQELPKMVAFANKHDIPLKIVNVETPRHLALQYANENFLQTILSDLSQINIKSELSIIAKRNTDSFYYFLNTIKHYISISKNRAYAIQEMQSNSLENNLNELQSLMHQNLLFKNFDSMTIEKLFSSVKTYLEENYNQVPIATINETIIRTILSFKEAEHEVDNAISNEFDEGFRMYKRLLDEFVLLAKQEPIITTS